MSELYYLQDSRDYVGDYMLFWRKEDRGYTTDPAQAQTYTEDELKRKGLRDTDIPWRTSYIDARISQVVSIEKCDKAERGLKQNVGDV